MTQQTSPFIEGKYGWAFGESGWNTGMDENLTKFSYLFDKNIDGVVASLPSAVSGQAYFLTTDNRVYFSVNNSWLSSPVPKWFIFTIKSTGQNYIFNGTALSSVPSNSDINARLVTAEGTLNALGTAAFQNLSYFASSAQLDVASAQANTYSDTVVNTFKSNLLDSSDITKGAKLVGYKGRTVADWLGDTYSIPGSYALLSDATSQIQALVDSLPAGATLTGNNLQFTVKAINFKSNMRLIDTKFKTKASAVIGEFWSPVTVGSYNDSTSRTNIRFENIYVDGNRVLNETGVGGGEDGGKHGFRFIGKIKGLVVKDCEAVNCGSYGFFNFVGINSGSDGTDNPLQEDILYLNCRSTGNKAHGFAADSVKGIKWIDCLATNNGFDITGSPGGTIPGGLYYGNGLDLEGYGIDSKIEDVYIINCDFRGNKAASIFLSDPVLVTNPAFKIRKKIRVIDSFLSVGANDSNSPGLSFDIEPPFANWALGALYDDIVISGGVVEGKINIISSTNVIINTTQIVTGILGQTAYSTVNINNLAGQYFTNLTSSQVRYKYQSSSTIDANSNRVWSRIESDGWCRQGIYSSRVSFAANEEKTIVIPFYVNLADNAYSAIPIVNFVSVNSSVGTPVRTTTTNTSVSVVIKNGASAQSIGLYCEIAGPL